MKYFYIIFVLWMIIVWYYAFNTINTIIKNTDMRTDVLLREATR